MERRGLLTRSTSSTYLQRQIQAPATTAGNAAPEPTDLGGLLDTVRAKEALQALTQPGLHIETLELDIAADIDPDVLGQLLSVVGKLSELRDLVLRVEGSEVGRIPEKIRCAIAGVPDCLKFVRIRRLLFSRLEELLMPQGRMPQEHTAQQRLQVLRAFLNMTQPVATDDRHWPAHHLLGLAMEAGDEALLLALAAASPGQQIDFNVLPDASTCSMLQNSRLRFRLTLSLFGNDSVHALCAWLKQNKGLLCEAIVLGRVTDQLHSSMADIVSRAGWGGLLNALVLAVNEGNLQAVKVTLSPHDWSVHEDDVPVRTARVGSLMIDCSDWNDRVRKSAVRLIQAFNPSHLSLHGPTLTNCCAVVAEAKKKLKLRLQGLYISPTRSKRAEREDDLSLANLFLDFPGPGHVSVFVPSRAFLDKRPMAQKLKQVADQNPLLTGVEWKPGGLVWTMDDPPQWRMTDVTPGLKSQHLSHWVNPLQLKRWQEGSVMFFEQYCRFTTDIGQYVIKVADFSETDLRHVGNMSRATRLRGQAVALAHAMNHELLGMDELKLLLSKPNGEIDDELVSELDGQLTNMKLKTHVWPMLLEATRPV